MSEPTQSPVRLRHVLSQLPDYVPGRPAAAPAGGVVNLNKGLVNLRKGDRVSLVKSGAQVAESR